MLKCEGFKMFKGTARIVPTNTDFPPYELEGTFLYRPDYDCWYGCGSSFPACIFTIAEDKTENI